MLHDLPSVITKKKKRVGRGMASGKGKTSGRGHNGQKSRGTGKIRHDFAGGQTPLVRRVPKLKGFTPFKSMDYQIVNLDKLNSFDDGQVVGKKEMAEKGFIKSANKPVKILGQGEINKKITVKADKFSQSAIDKLTKAGGKHEILSDAL